MSEAAQRVRDFLKRYEGDFPFLLSLKRKAKDPNWQPTQRQIQAVGRCMQRSASMYHRAHRGFSYGLR